VLIDSGTGGGQIGGPKTCLLAQSMAAAGLDPKAVNTIVVSHFHLDHISGLMAKDTNAQMFPDAEIVVPAFELKWWTQPVESIPQPRRGNAQRVQATFPNWKNVRVVDGRRRGARHPRHSGAWAHPRPHRASHQLRRQAAARHGRRHRLLSVCSIIPIGSPSSTTCRIWRWKRARSCSIARSPTRPWSPAITGACRTSARSQRTAAATRSRRRGEISK